MHTRFLLFASLILINITSVWADFSIDWTTTSDAELFNTGTAVARDGQDNVYTSTATGSIYMEKHDKFGNFKWRVKSSTNIPFNYEYPSQIYVDPQNNPVIVGYRYTDPDEGNNANSLIVLKYDPSGNLLYKLNIDGDYSYFSSSPLSNFWTKITSQMDAAGNIYIGTAGGVDGYPNPGFCVVKVSSSGNIIWVSQKSFVSSTQFHFVNNIRLRGNKIGLTGFTSYPYANCTNWVLDVSGQDIWSNIKEGGGGRDLAFDKKGNSYFLTSISVNSLSDIRIYKFSPTGTLLYQKNYDFGGSELPAIIKWSPDNTFVVSAYGNTAPAGSLYVDWITFKISPNGAKLWSIKYAKHSNNDEFPNWMEIDLDGDIFITGIGGPFPGGSNLGKQQMVTVKYTPNGVEEWASALDTLNDYNQGVGIAIASDGSLYVLGSANTFLVHYLDHTGSDPCNIPTGITVTSITSQAATISWNPVGNAELYHIQYKPATATVWLQISTDSTSFTLTSLDEGTTYDYHVEAICNSGPTGYSPVNQFGTLGQGYCPSMGMDATHEWIDLVYISTLLNSTPENDGGYGNYTNLSVDLIQGKSYELTLSAEIDPFGAYEVWRVWIDFNHDNDFLDAGEKVVGYKSQQIGWESHTFTVPSTAQIGNTRMRVSLKRSTAPAPCEIFPFGEVEDYTVNILPAKSNQPDAVQLQSISPAIMVAPNPAEDLTVLHVTGIEVEALIQIFDMTGKVIYSRTTTGNGDIVLDMSSWKSGLYLVRVSDANGVDTETKVVKQ